MLNWKDRKYVNPRKKVFKNLDTNEILNLEIQDDPDNILEESETPLTAHNLNLAQAELVDDIGTQTQSEREVLTLEEAIQENTEYEIPVTYEVGNNSLEIYYQGTKLIKGIEYLEVGTEGTFSNKIKFHNWGQNVPVGRTIEFIVRGTILTKAITSEETKAQIEIIKAEQTEQNTNIEANANEIEAIKQENALLRSQIPQGSAEGEYITLKDSSNLPFDEFKIEGNSEQATRDGRNLYNYADARMISEGVTVDDDGWITITCDNTNGTTKKYLNYFTNNLNLETDTNYNIIAEVKNVNGTGAIHFISAVPTEKQFETGFYKLFSNIANNNVYNSINKTLTTALGNYGLRTFAVYEIGQSGSITFRLSVLKDTTITPESFEYEPYGVMPSPEFSSDIRNCGDDIQLFNKDTTTDGKYIDNEGILKSQETATVSDYIEIKINKDFYVSGKKSTWVSYALYDKDKTFLSRNVTTTPNGILKVTNTNCKYIRMNLSLEDKDTLKIQEGSIATPWSPYGCGTINIEKCNKNLASTEIIKSLNKPAFTNIATNGFTVDLSQGSVGNLNLIDIMFGKLDGSKQYTLSYHLKQNNNTFNPKLAFYYTDGTSSFPAIFSNSEKDISFSSTAGKIIERISFLWSTQTSGSLAEFSNIQLELGETATSYVEHEGQTHTIYTQKPFRKVDSTRDTFIKKNKWNERHYIKRLILDGTEDWHRDNSSGYFYLLKENYNYKASTACMSNFYVRPASLSGVNYGIAIGNAWFVTIKNIDYSTIAEFKSYLAEQYTNGTPVYVDYILETPEDIECIQEQTNQLNELINSGTYKNITHICSLDEIKPTHEVKYRKDLETLLGGVANE